MLLFWDAAIAGWRPRRRAMATAALLMASALTATSARAEDAGLRAYRAGRFAEAVAHWRTVIKAGDQRLATRYNLGTALLAAGQLDSAIAVLDPLSRLVTGDLRTRTLFNLGLAHLARARAPQGDPGSYALAADCYRRVLLAESGNADAKFNYELAHRRKDGGGGGGAAPPPPQPPEGQQPSQQPRSTGGLDKQQAEQLLDNAARDERDTQKRKSQRQKGEPPKVEKDW